MFIGIGILALFALAVAVSVRLGWKPPVSFLGMMAAGLVVSIVSLSMWDTDQDGRIAAVLTVSILIFASLFAAALAHVPENAFSTRQ